MNYVFFGTPRFAELVLHELIAAGMPPAAVVCNPDRPVGRRRIMTPPQVKQLAERNGIRVLQPEKLDTAFEQELAALRPDFFVVAAYAKIIPQSVLDIARIGTLGTHPSLLPKYRGASPIQSVLLNDEARTGATIYLMDAKMDHGPILAQDELAIRGNETYLELEGSLAQQAGRLLAKTIPPFFAGTLEPRPQNDSDATFTKKFTTENGFVPEHDLAAAESGDAAQAERIDRMIRALDPEPGAWTTREGKRIKLLAARNENGTLRLTRIQREGEKPKDAPGGIVAL